MKLKRSALGALSVVALVGSSLAIGATSASGDPSANVTICHRTNSNTNPYVKITVDESAVDGVGGSDHLGQHTGPVWDPTLKADHIKWGDIIPPFDMNGDPRPDPSLIANWPEGQDIFENGCKPVEPPAPELVDLSVAKEVVGTVPDGVADFTAQVTCDDGTSVEVTLPVDGGLGTPSPIQVEQGSQCTVVETATGGADQVGYSIVGVDVDPGVFIDTDTTVTITNTFDEPQVSPEVVEVSPAEASVAPAAVVAAPALTG